MRRNRNELVTVVKQLKENDSYAFSRLYELTYQKLYFFCYSLLKNEHDAQDALQETYIKIYSNLHSLENDDSFVVWMNKISYNVCITMIKKKKELLGEDILCNIPADSSQHCPEEKTIISLENKQLAVLIDELDSTLRTVLILKYFEEMKLGQIAQIMGCPVGTVKSRLNTAKKTLRRKLQKRVGADFLLRLIPIITIKEALGYLAKKSVLQVHAADSVFEHIVNKADLPATLSFIPQNVAVPVAGGVGIALGGSAIITGCAATAAVGSLLFSPLSFGSVSVQTPDASYTKDPVTITAHIHGPLNNIDEIYALSHETNKITYGTIEEGNVGHFIVTESGDYTLYAIDNRKRMVTATTTVSCIDRSLPVLKDYKNTNSQINFYIEDSLSGIDYSSIYGETVSGKKIYPQQVDQAAGELIFSFPGEDFRLSIQDAAGNEAKYLIKHSFE